MPNITFKEAQEIAIAEARRLNAEGGTQKWKTVSMSDNGKWFADECEPNKMKPDFIMGFQRSPYGFDTILENVPKCDCERDAWENSVASVIPKKTKMKVVISFELPDGIVNAGLSNARYDAEKAFMKSIIKQVETKMHVPSLMVQGDRGITLTHEGAKIGTIKIKEIENEQ